MKTLQFCPKCQSRQLWIVERMALPEPDSGNTVFVMPVAAQEVRDNKRWDRIAGGTFEAWICAHCGFTEWYAKDANAVLTELARLPNGGVRWLDTTPQRGPFR